MDCLCGIWPLVLLDGAEVCEGCLAIEAECECGEGENMGSD